ncbi:putative B3 domain-containing protein At2g27410 [Hevea brasiliensis]|uniref:putative B3 domain-containing protein At2g27410 n=1 Tax=Hevea brasiliensis TaxID=3981 RepID=UPI0025EFF020|nr:putative B3 domain-containing protein At2g27410 [Hevea brasiliensis]
MQQVRAEAIIKHDDRLVAYVPKKSRGHRQRLDIKPHSHSSLSLHVKSSGSMNENKKRTPTDMPEEWWHKIQAKGGIDVKLAIMKQMFATDLSTHHNCFSIPFKQIRDFSFLTEDEKRKLKEPKEKMPVTLMEPCG